MSDFLAFERSTNPLLLALDSRELAHELDGALAAGATLFVPQGVSFGDTASPDTLPALLRTHSAVFNPDNRTQFATLGGLLGILEGDIATTGSVYVFGTTAAAMDPAAVFAREQAHFIAAAQTPERNRHIVVVLREGKLDLAKGGSLPFLLISEPLTAPLQQSQQPLLQPQVLDPVVRATPRRSTFFQKLRLPEAANVVRDLNAFARKLGGRLPRRTQDQAAEVHGFINKLRYALIAGHPLWRSCSQEELDDIADGAEKYLTAKLFPAIFPLPEERTNDERLAARIRELWFVTREHLGVPSHIAAEQLALAVSELSAINRYKSPQDKATIVLNCCKILSGACRITNSQQQQQPEKRAIGADELLPMLIHVVLKSATPNLASNAEYVMHFRNPRRFANEAKYCVTLLRSAISFVIDMTSESLCSITPDEFAELCKSRRPVSQPQFYETETTAAAAAAGASLPMPATSLPMDITTRSRRASDASSVSPLSPGALVFDDMLFSPSPEMAPPSSVPASRPGTPKYRFADMRPEDLKIGDIPALLAEYKELVQRVAFLERGTQPQQRPSTSSLSPAAADLLLR